MAKSPTCPKPGVGASELPKTGDLPGTGSDGASLEQGQFNARATPRKKEMHELCGHSGELVVRNHEP